MNNLQKISRCLISVSDKEGVVELAKFLESQNVEIISTGGTKKLLLDNKINAKDISEFTLFPEIMDGRLKTLHPKVHGGLLAVLNNESHQKQAKENDISSIDLLIVNLYPFVETVAKTDDEAKIIENIDIGGPAMVRSAAKNFLFKAVITDKLQYQNLIAQMKENSSSTSFDFRKELAKQAFRRISDYDLAIANWFDGISPSDFILQGSLKQNLRYGENSHQKAAIYSNSNHGIVNAKQLQGKELSYNNLNDADAAYNLVMEFEKPACVVVKHANPCGVAIADNLNKAYQDAFNADSKSAFGGIVALNGKINLELAQKISEIFYEVIIAKEIDEDAKEFLLKKKNLRVLIADFVKPIEPQIKTISGGFLLQENDYKKIDISSLKQVSKVGVNEKDLEQLAFAMTVCKYVKSNAITLVKDFQTVGLGIGQTNRVDACEIACQKAKNFLVNNEIINKAQGSFLASDAFFPFADNIEMAAKYGIKAIIAPAGSIRDNEVIAKADEKGIALYFIESRHFRH